MRLTAFAAAILFGMIVARPAQALGDDIIELEIGICKSYARMKDKAEAKKCFEDLIHELESKKTHITKLQAINAATRAYVGKYGLGEPDIDAKYLVAKRKRLLFAMISEACRTRARTALDIDAFNNCLDQLTKAEQMLGSDLKAPAPKGWPNP